MGQAMSSHLLRPPFSWSSQGQQHLKIIVLGTLGGHEVEQTNGPCPWGNFQVGLYFLSFEWFPRRPKRMEGGCGVHLPYCSRKVCCSCRLWSLGIVLPDRICVFHWHKMPAKLFFLSVLVIQDLYSSYGLESVEEWWLEQTAFYACYYHFPSMQCPGQIASLLAY